MIRALVLLALLTVAAIFAPPAWMRAWGHDWYPLSCCSGLDCIPIAADAVRETREGYLIRETGELIPHGDLRIKVTPPEDLDQGYHWCRHLKAGSNAYTGKTWAAGETICLFVPGRGV